MSSHNPASVGFGFQAKQEQPVLAALGALDYFLPRA